jgi:hypothetical protein
MIKALHLHEKQFTLLDNSNGISNGMETQFLRKKKEIFKQKNGNTKLVIQKRFLTNANRERLKLDDEIKVFFNEP